MTLMGISLARLNPLMRWFFVNWDRLYLHTGIFLQLELPILDTTPFLDTNQPNPSLSHYNS
jgi:hypothetical protein